MVTYAYACCSPDGVDDEIETLESFCAARDLPPPGRRYTLGLREGILADLGTGAGRRKLSTRREGGRLFNLLQRGDHVVFSSAFASFHGFLDWLESLSLWGKLGITVHFADDGMTIPPGAPCVRDAELLAQLMFVLAGFRIRVRQVATAAGVSIRSRRSADKFPIDRLEELTRRAGGTVGRVFPCVRASLHSAALQEVCFADQESIVRGRAKTLAAERRLVVERTSYDDSLRTAGFRFMDCPQAGRVLQEVQRGDVVIVHSVPSAFRSVADLVATQWFVRARGAELLVAAENLTTATIEGRRCFDSLAKLVRLRHRWQLPTSRGESWREPTRAYLRERAIEGKTVRQMDGESLRIVRSVQKFAVRGWSARKIASRLERLESERYGDGVLIPHRGIRVQSGVAAKLHPDHGMRGKTRIRRRWSLQECELMRDRSYWLELERVAAEQGFRRAPRTRWPRRVP